MPLAQPFRSLTGAVLLASALLVSGCGDDDSTEGDDSTETSDPELANPASEFCVDQGGEVDIVEGADGEAGVCVLPDGTRIDEWEYFQDNAPAES